MLEEIYNKIYASPEELRKEDHEASSQLTPLIEDTDLKAITQEEFAELMCRACAVGEKIGFISGARFWARLVCEALS
jgi:hypothetical protein